MSSRKTNHVLHTLAVAALLALAAVVGVQALGPRQAAAQNQIAPAVEIDPAVADGLDPNSIPSKSMFGIIRAGGLLMIPVMFCSFLTLVFAFERMIALRAGRVIPKPFVKRMLHQLREGQLDRDEALKLCEENRSPVAEVFGGAIRKWGRPSVEVEQALLDEGERAVNGLRRYLRVFNGVATISPLLGLLGTVFGMIKAFNEIAASDAMGRPELLAAGISEALITTAAGLTVAIPALVFYLFFVSRVDQLIIQIDALGQELVRCISGEALQEAGNRTKGSRGRAA